MIEMHNFLDLVIYRRMFHTRFLLLAAPVTWVMRKEECFVWMGKCEESFQTLKEKCMTTLVLSVSDSYMDFVMYSNESGIYLGYMLMQRGQIIAFVSRAIGI